MERVIGYDCDGEEIEEFRILRFPFSSEIEDWNEEPNIDPRFYCAVVGFDNSAHLISVYDDYNTEYIRKFEKICENEEVPTVVKNINECKNYEVQ